MTPFQLANITVLIVTIVVIIYFLKEHYRLVNGGRMWMQANIWLRKNAPDYVMTCIENFRRKADKAVVVFERFEKHAGVNGPRFHVGKIEEIKDDLVTIIFFKGEYKITVHDSALNTLCPNKLFKVGDRIDIFVGC